MTLIGEEDIRIEPAGDVESLRRDHQHVGRMTLAANSEIVLDNIQGNAMEIVAEIDTKNAPMVEMDVLRSPNKEEVTRIMFFKDRGFRNRERNTQKSLITIDSSCSSILPDVRTRAPETGSVSIEPDETLKLRVFVDKSVVEVFVNGKQCVALRVYPGARRQHWRLHPVTGTGQRTPFSRRLSDGKYLHIINIPPTNKSPRRHNRTGGFLFLRFCYSFSYRAAKIVSFVASPICSSFGRRPDKRMLSLTRFKNPSPLASIKLLPVSVLL